jgi:methylmalonyl-CoA/ethylmalonyl-CoA epimerase
MSFMLTPEVEATRLAHIGIAVRDLDEAARFYREVLGLVPHGETAADGARILEFDLGETGVELLTSQDPESPIGRFLARHGPGIHHVCFRVPDLDGALARCRAAGYRLIDDSPRPGADGRRVAFVHPKATAGILLELTD